MVEGEFIAAHCLPEEMPSCRRLQKAWRTACLSCLILTTACFGGLSVAWQPAAALRWLLQAAAVNAFVLWLLWKALNQNFHPAIKILQSNLGYANWLTLLRGFLIGALAGFLFQPSAPSAEGSRWLAWAPGAIYTLAVVLDYFDGYIARFTGHETRLGEWLDTKMDALGLLVAPLLAIWYGRLPIFYIAVGFAYYLFQFGIRYREDHGLPVTTLAPHPAKRMIAGFQMGLVAVALFPIFSRPAITIAAAIFMIPLLAGFIRDWLVVCGNVEINSLQQTRWDRPINLLTTKLLPVILRCVIGIAGIFFFYCAVTAFFTDPQTVSGTRLYLTASFSLFKLGITGLAVLLAVSGILTRFAALTISLLLAGNLTSWNSSPALFLVFSCAAALMLTGSGLLSIWHPEDALLLERQGRSFSGGRRAVNGGQAGFRRSRGENDAVSR